MYEGSTVPFSGTKHSDGIESEVDLTCTETIAPDSESSIESVCLESTTETTTEETTCLENYYQETVLEAPACPSPPPVEIHLKQGDEFMSVAKPNADPLRSTTEAEVITIGNVNFVVHRKPPRTNMNQSNTPASFSRVAKIKPFVRPTQQNYKMSNVIASAASNWTTFESSTTRSVQPIAENMNLCRNTGVVVSTEAPRTVSHCVVPLALDTSSCIATTQPHVEKSVQAACVPESLSTNRSGPKLLTPLPCQYCGGIFFNPELLL